MKNQKSKLNLHRIFIISIILMSLMFTTTIFADPIIEIKPSEPEPKSTIEVIVSGVDANADSVNILIQECEGSDLCRLQRNLTLESDGENTYKKSITLEYPATTYIQYTIEVHTDDGWTEFAKNTKVNLKQQSTPNNNGGSEDTPGFELIGILLSVIFISIILYNRKR